MDLDTVQEGQSGIFESDSAEFYESAEFFAFVETRRPEVRRYVNKLLSLFTRLTPHPDVDWVTNGVFQKIYAKIKGERIAEPSSATRRRKRFFGLVYRIAYNDIVSHVKQEMRHRGSLTYEPELDTQAVERHVIAERESMINADEPITDEALAALRFALSQLSTLDSAVLLNHAEGKSYRDLAATFRCSEGTLRVRHMRALQRLKMLLCGEGMSPPKGGKHDY